jgi:hypothetical protein
MEHTFRTARLCAAKSRSNGDTATVLEALLHCDIPSPAPDICRRFVISVFERGCDKRRLEVHYVGCAVGLRRCLS